MDLSKLPKLSQTPAPPVPVGDEINPPVPDDSQATRVYERRGQESLSIAEIWISLIVGLILLMWCPTMMKYLSSLIFHTEFAPFFLADGTILPYPKVYPQFWSDLCITAFAFVLILEGVALSMARKRWLVTLAFGMTVLATLLNLGFIFATFASYGAPVVSLLAVAFGVYIALYQWRLLRSLLH